MSYRSKGKETKERDCQTGVNRLSNVRYAFVKKPGFASNPNYDIMISHEGKLEMAQFVVRNIENTVKARLQRRARRNGRSMEEEVRDILRSAVHGEDGVLSGGLGSEISALFADAGLDFEIPELRGQPITPPFFDE